MGRTANGSTHIGLAQKGTKCHHHSGKHHNMYITPATHSKALSTRSKIKGVIYQGVMHLVFRILTRACCFLVVAC
jgi:hypothetical protein